MISLDCSFLMSVKYLKVRFCQPVSAIGSAFRLCRVPTELPADGPIRLSTSSSSSRHLPSVLGSGSDKNDDTASPVVTMYFERSETRTIIIMASLKKLAAITTVMKCKLS